jgi:hypothetical protein
VPKPKPPVAPRKSAPVVEEVKEAPPVVVVAAAEEKKAPSPVQQEEPEFLELSLRKKVRIDRAEMQELRVVHEDFMRMMRETKDELSKTMTALAEERVHLRELEDKWNSVAITIPSYSSPSLGARRIAEPVSPLPVGGDGAGHHQPPWLQD